MSGLTELLLLSVGIVVAVGLVLWLMHFASSRSTSGGDDVREPLRAAIKALIASADDPDESMALPAWVGHEVDEAEGEAMAGARNGRRVNAVLNVDVRGRAHLSVWMATSAKGRFHLEVETLRNGGIVQTIDQHDTDAAGRVAMEQIPDELIAELAATWPTDDLRHQPGALSWESAELKASPQGGTYQTTVRTVLNLLEKIASRVE